MLSTFFLGIVQGITEFLPVSSSGHLTIFQALFGMKNPDANLTLDIILHGGTLLAVIWFFRADLRPFFTVSGWRDPSQRSLARTLILGSAVTALIGLSLKDQFEQLFGQPKIVCGTLFLTGVILLLAHHFGKKASTFRALSECTMVQALLIGFAQGIAITPGISRSGMTIAAGILCGLSGSDAARLSFLLMIPAVGGATLLEFRKFFKLGLPAGLSGAELAVGGLSALVFGWLSLTLLMSIMKKQRLHLFSYYLFTASLLAYVALNSFTGAHP
jgi:undecaprenyl-diphosphatase